MGTLGDKLRDARQRLQLSLDDVESATKIRKKYLIALEQEDFARLPALIYAKGFLRTYALFLGLDADTLVEQVPEPPAPTTLEPAMHVPKPPRAIGSLLVVTLIIAMVGAVGVYLYQQGLSMPIEPEVVAIEIPTPTAVPTATPSPIPAVVVTRTVALQVKAIEPTWISVTIDTQPAFAGRLEIGDNHTWTGKDLIALRIGNAGGLDVVANGQRKGYLGRPGEVLNAELSAEGLKVLAASSADAAATPTRVSTPQANR